MLKARITNFSDDTSEEQTDILVFFLLYLLKQNGDVSQKLFPLTPLVIICASVIVTTKNSYDFHVRVVDKITKVKEVN